LQIILYATLNCMAFIGLRVPLEVGRLLSTIEVPGKKETSDFYHITIAMLGSDVPIEKIGKAIIALHDVAANTNPFRVAINSVSSFPEGDHGYPVVCLVYSPELHKLEQEIKSALDMREVEYSKKFPIFRPHVTLAYSPSKVKDKIVGPVEWSAYEFVLWGGDSGDERISVRLPFALPGKTALFRSLIQASMRFIPSTKV
jgi:2'-5' RNA ligase